MQDGVISHIHELSQNEPMGVTFTNKNEHKIEEDDDDNNYVTSDKEDIDYNGSDHPGDGWTSDSGDDCPSDDDGPEPHFAPTINDNDTSTGSHDTTNESKPTDNTGIEVKNITQSNR